MNKIAVLAFLLVLLPLSSLEAQTVLRSGDTVSVAEDQKIVGNFYSLTNILSLSGEVEGDLVAGAGQITINGNVTEDVFIVGGSIDVHGTIGDDLRVIGGEVVIAEPVLGDVFVVGGKVNILSTASVAGDILVYGGEVTIAGSVGGSVFGRMGTLRIDGPVVKDINVTADSVILGERAKIDGGVTYVSNQLLTRAQNATVLGDVVRNDGAAEESVSPTMILLPFLMLLFSVLVWFLIGRSLLQKIADRAVVRSVRPALIGLAVLLFAPVAIVVLLLSVLGSMVGAVVLFAYFLATVLSLVGLSAVAGVILMKAFNQPIDSLNLVTVLIGTFFVGIALLLPFIGPIVVMALFLVTLGALCDIVLRPNNP